MKPNMPMMNTTRLRQLTSVIVVIAVWQLATGVSGILDPSVLPPPFRIGVSLILLLTDSQFITHVFTTLRRTVIATIIAIPAGTVVGIAMGWDDRVKAVLSPILYALYPMPVIALLPLLLIIFGSGDLALIFLATLGGFFVLVWNAMTAVGNIDVVYFEVARDNGATSTAGLFREVLLPGSISLIFTGLRLCLSTTLLIVIATEFISANNGLGFFLWQSWRTYLLAEMYAGVFVIGIIGICVTYGLQRLRVYLVPWESTFEERIFV